jgi:hypothetical protein
MAVAGYNKTEHGAINTAPADMTDEAIFSLRKEAAVNFAENSDMIQKRQDKLQAQGGYRVHIPHKTGLTARTDVNTWSSDIRQVSSFPAPGIVQDTEGNRTLTKLTRPVPADSSATAQTQTPQHTQLEPYALKIRGFIGGGKGFAQTSKEMKQRDPQFPGALKANKTSFKDFVQVFPKLLRIHEGKIYPRDLSPAAPTGHDSHEARQARKRLRAEIRARDAGLRTAEEQFEYSRNREEKQRQKIARKAANEAHA